MTNRGLGFRLNHSGLLESLESAALLHGLKTFCGYANGHLFAELRDKESLGLEIHLTAALAGRVELGSTNTVGVAAPDLRFLACYCAFTSHMCADSTEETARAQLL